MRALAACVGSHDQLSRGGPFTRTLSLPPPPLSLAAVRRGLGGDAQSPHVHGRRGRVRAPRRSASAVPGSRAAGSRRRGRRRPGPARRLGALQKERGGAARGWGQGQTRRAGGAAWDRRTRRAGGATWDRSCHPDVCRGLRGRAPFGALDPRVFSGGHAAAQGRPHRSAGHMNNFSMGALGPTCSVDESPIRPWPPASGKPQGLVSHTPPVPSAKAVGHGRRGFCTRYRRHRIK